MRRFQARLGVTIATGMLIAIAFVLLGGITYLILHGDQLVHFETFHHAHSDLKTIVGIFKNVLNWTPSALIQCGLLILVLTQFAGVGLVVCTFFKFKDYLFTCISLCILIVMLYSLSHML